MAGGLHLPKINNTYFLAVIATFGGMLFGFDISSMSAIIGTQQYVDFFDNPKGIVQGSIGAALAAGSIVGSLIAGPLSDKIGRRDANFVACIFWLIGTSVQVAVQSTGMLIAGRVINGVCVGITSSQVPVYLAEISRKEKRGSIIVIQQLAIEWGIFIMYFVGYGCSFISGPASFRTAWGIQFVPATILMLGIPFLHRSPRWLAKVGRVDEAVHVLAAIQAKGDRTDPLVIAEWEEITTTLRAEREAMRGWRKFFAKGMWKRTLAGFSVQAWQQLSGANVMTYYVVYIFQMANLRGNVNLVASGVQYALFIIFTSIIFFYIDRTGRRFLLFYGAIGMGVCHFVVGGLLSGGTAYPNGYKNNPNVTIAVTGNRANGVIAFSYLLIIVYALTLAPVAWVYAAEVWSLETRAWGMSIAAVANWLFNFAIGLFIPPAFVNISWKLFIIFGLMCLGSACQTWFTFPETAGKTLEEIEFMFSREGPHAWQTKPGGSRLDAEVEAVRQRKATAHSLAVGTDGHFHAVDEKGSITDETVDSTLAQERQKAIEGYV